ncbi:MAG: TonB-dependent receptor plug domain-containing protein [Kordiimonadaceae bacterium]|nr:TonB-dependent receptor plug domain-containing protein [Kordiimonadaceae bacterium]
MKHHHKYYRSVSLSAMLLAGLTGPITPEATAADDSEDLLFEEIVVFSRSRKESSLSIPQTVDLIDNKLLKSVAALTIGDALRFVPGASQDGSKLDAFSDNYLIRGFGSDQTINGASKNRLNHSRDAVNVERIEVLKGPASVLYGQLEPGAVVNVVTKQAEEDFSAEVSFEAGRFDHYRGTLDVTGSLTDSGNVRFRLTGAYEDSDAFVDFWNREHIFIAPTIAFDIGEDTTFTVEALYSKNTWSAFYNGVPILGTLEPNANGVIPANRHLADPTLDGTVRRTSDVTARLDHSFNDDVALRAVVSWTEGVQDYEEVFALPVAGYFPIGPSEAEQTRLVNRVLLTTDSNTETYAAHLDLSFSLNTGPVAHDLAIGVDYQSRNSKQSNGADLLFPLDQFTPTYSLDERPASPSQG